jgi:hypothetical protein
MSGTERNLHTGDCVSKAMKYRGVEYQVVQTASLTGWKWTVELDQNRSRTGTTPTRAAAIALAQRFIDTALKNAESAQEGSEPNL